MTKPDTSSVEEKSYLELDEINQELMGKLNIPLGLYSPSERNHLITDVYYNAALPEIHRLRKLIDKLVKP